MTPQLFAATATPLTPGEVTMSTSRRSRRSHGSCSTAVPTATSSAGRPARDFCSPPPSASASPSAFARPADGILIVHCGAQSTAETVALAAHSAKIGADGVAVIPPPYFPLDDDAITEHLVAAAAACAPVPFYLYAFTERSGYPLTPAVAERVRDRSTNVAGLKVSDSTIEGVEPYLRLGLPIYVGSEVVIPDALKAGAAGSVSGIASAFPEAVAALVHDPGPETVARVAAISAAVDTTAFIAALKHLLIARGVPIGPAVRPPQRLLTEHGNGKRSNLRSRSNWEAGRDRSLDTTATAELEAIIAELRPATDGSRCTLRLDIPGDYAFPVVCESLAPGVDSLMEFRTVGQVEGPNLSTYSPRAGDGGAKRLSGGGERWRRRVLGGLLSRADRHVRGNGRVYRHARLARRTARRV